MTIFVVDTCVVREMLFHFRRDVPAFDRMWDKVDHMIVAGEVVFVKESYDELERQCTTEQNVQWLKARKNILLRQRMMNVS